MIERRGDAGRTLVHAPAFLRALAAGTAALLACLRRAAAQDPPAPAAKTAGTATQEAVADVGALVRMLDDTLELARGLPDAGRREPVDVHEPIAAAVSRHDPARVTVGTAPGPLFVLASATALQHLFEILVDNALASAARVIVRLDHGTTALVVHVDDDGPGVPQRARAHLFDPFPTSPENVAGRCVRLAIAQRIARAHGGEITVSCSPEGGARFTVRLPRILDHELELAAAS